MGGAWDATNVADADVAVVTPIDLDHTHPLGRTITEIAREKAGIIKPGAHAILAGQTVEAAEVLLARCAEVGALPQREGIDFGVIDRRLAVAGQLLRLNSADGPVNDIFLPLFGAHQASNAAQASRRDRGVFSVSRRCILTWSAKGFAPPGPPSWPAGAGTPLAGGGAGRGAQPPWRPSGRGRDHRGIRLHPPLIGVVAVMADKDARGVLEVLEEIMNQVVITQVALTLSRAVGRRSSGNWPRRSSLLPRHCGSRLDDAIEQAVAGGGGCRRLTRCVDYRVGAIAISEARPCFSREESVVVPGSENLARRSDAALLRRRA